MLIAYQLEAACLLREAACPLARFVRRKRARPLAWAAARAGRMAWAAGRHERTISRAVAPDGRRAGGVSIILRLLYCYHFYFNYKHVIV